MHLHFTVLDMPGNLAWRARQGNMAGGGKTDAGKHAIVGILARSGLGEFAPKRCPHPLPGGQRQRGGIAGTIPAKPEFRPGWLDSGPGLTS